MFEPRGKRVDPRGALVSFRVTQNERRELENAASQKGVTLSDLARVAVSQFLAAQPAETQEVKNVLQHG